MIESGIASQSREALVRQAFANQAQWCERLGSPFTSLLCRALADHIDRTTAIGQRILDWPGDRPDALGDAVPLRIAGGLHALVRRGRLPELGKLYPPNPLPDVTALSNGVVAAFASADADLSPWLDGPPQTNEVARSAQIFAGLCEIASATGLPLALYEIGASAGLNLHCDMFAYRFGDSDHGLASSPLRLAPRWNGPAPARGDVRVVSRRGCDLDPLDPANPDHRERLIAYTWADQSERLDRLEKALTIASASDARVEQADAAAWVEAMACDKAPEGVVRVLYHTIARQYFPAAVTARLDRAIAQLASTATDLTPFAWLKFEQDPAFGRPSLRLTLWPSGEERVLSTGDAHGREVQWLG